jgi:hypothetical protein
MSITLFSIKSCYTYRKKRVSARFMGAGGTKTPHAAVFEQAVAADEHRDIKCNPGRDLRGKQRTERKTAHRKRGGEPMRCSGETQTKASNYIYSGRGGFLTRGAHVFSFFRFWTTIGRLAGIGLMADTAFSLISG